MPRCCLYENNSYQLLTEGCTMLGIFEELPFMSVTKVLIPNKACCFAIPMA